MKTWTYFNQDITRDYRGYYVCWVDTGTHGIPVQADTLAGCKELIKDKLGK